VERSFLIQGHRGARGLAPENTLPSFRMALDAGADSVETDVHLTADGVPVLSHDPTLADGRVIRSLSAAEVAAAGVPTLADLYRFVTACRCESKPTMDVIVDVEIKSVPFRAEPDRRLVERAVLEVSRAADAVASTWVRSFDHRIVRHLRESELGLTGVVLIDGTAPVDPVGLVRAADAQVYGPDYRFLDEQQVRSCRAAGIRVLPWTVNDPADWERLISWGVDGITTDYPDRLAKWLKRVRGRQTGQA
jgi:glycerophosphoryl diester phosphodiesterase